ncbi:protein 5NUC [Ixodes scapularis]
MSRMMYDSVCLGNHEFDDGPEGLAPFLKRMVDANVTVLGTNLDTSKEPLLNGTDLKKSIIYEVGKLKIGVMGVVTKETMQIARPGKIIILDEIASIKEEVQNLKKKQVTFYVVISHVGYELDKKIAAEVEEIDLVVGGHTNTFLYTGKPPRPEDKVEGYYPTIVNKTSKRHGLVVQDYWAGKYLGHLELEFNHNGSLKSWSGNPILLDNTTKEDTEMACVLDSYKEVVENASKEYIGLTKVKLEASDKVCRIKECNTANLITDAFLAFYADRNTTNNTEDWSDVNAAVVNSGIAKTTVEQGVILRENMMSMMPYESTLYVLTMTGLQLTKMFEHGASKFTWFEDPEGAFLQASGIRVAFNFSLPKECRVIKLDILCAKCKIPKYEPVMLNETYRIVTTSYIANGGDGFKFDESVKKETEATQTSPGALQAQPAGLVSAAVRATTLRRSPDALRAQCILPESSSTSASAARRNPDDPAPSIPEPGPRTPARVIESEPMSAPAQSPLPSTSRAPSGPCVALSSGEFPSLPPSSSQPKSGIPSAPTTDPTPRHPYNLRSSF